MTSYEAFQDFTNRLRLLISKHPALITTTLSNIFTMRLIGNKTHGDLAEIAISEFINQYMYDFRSAHVGKDLFRAKSQEEDIRIINEITQAEIAVSLKAYGDGPLQLSTDKHARMFARLEQEEGLIEHPDTIAQLFQDPSFAEFRAVHVLPLIYNEREQRCNIMVFDYRLAQQKVARIHREETGRGRKHPVYRFYDAESDYVCEVRYGGAAANALQRGLWTHTQKGSKYFNSLTNGWLDYSHNLTLVKLFSHALVASETGHQSALDQVQTDITRLKQQAGFA